MIIKRPRGTYDIFGSELNLKDFLIKKMEESSKKYNFRRMITPIFEHKELFTRNIGETSDIVSKEIYDFKDKSNRDLALRPEGTIGVVRSIVENKLLHTNPLPLKYYYYGSMFRYERPQSGRAREFNQFGIESIGIYSKYQVIEVIQLAMSFLKELNLENFILKINYIGCFETRLKWIDSLKEYFKKYENDLSNDSKERINKNPLRILDDKIDGSKEFVKNAPSISEFYNKEEIKSFDEFKTLFKKLKINFEHDSSLVRGLDYYSGLVFEVIGVLPNKSNTQTIIGGGEYFHLTKELGEKENWSCGFALGIERFYDFYLECNNNKFENDFIDFYLLPLTENALDYINENNLISNLRKEGYSIDINYTFAKLDKQLKQSRKHNPKYLIIVGDDEIKNKTIKVKSQITMKEEIINCHNFLNEISLIVNK